MEKNVSSVAEQDKTAEVKKNPKHRSMPCSSPFESVDIA